MNDFVIQGVTILGTEISNHIFSTIPLILSVLISLILFFFVGMSIFEKMYPSIAVCFFFFMLAIFATFLSYKEWKAPPETIYTISIDNTASYNEIKNNFYYIRELPNGLYKVKLNTEGIQND